MSSLNIDLTLDNDAFTDDASTEVARILRRLADTIEGANPLDTFTLRDINGNTVGQAVFSWTAEGGDEDGDMRRAVAFVNRMSWADVKRALSDLCGIQLFAGETADTHRYALATQLAKDVITEDSICQHFGGKY